MPDSAGERLRHVAVAPIGLPQPVADMGPGRALQMAGRPHLHADDADGLFVEHDHETGPRIIGRGFRLLANEALHVLARIRPGRRAEPPYDRPMGETGKQTLANPLADRTQSAVCGSRSERSSPCSACAAPAPE